MPAYNFSWSISGSLNVLADNETHARELFNKMSAEKIASKGYDELEIHSVDYVPNEEGPKAVPFSARVMEAGRTP